MEPTKEICKSQHLVPIPLRRLRESHRPRGPVRATLERIRQNSFQILDLTITPIVGQPTKGAVNIGDIVGISGGQTTKGAVNIGVILCVSVSVAGADGAGLSTC